MLVTLQEINQLSNYGFRPGKDLTIISLPCVFHHAQNHPLMEVADVLLQKMMDFGVIQRIKDVAVFRYSRKVRDAERARDMDSQWHTIAPKHVAPMLALIMIMLLLCVITFVCEVTTGYACQVSSRFFNRNRVILN